VPGGARGIRFGTDGLGFGHGRLINARGKKFR
jgi:hypothetical protein